MLWYQFMHQFISTQAWPLRKEPFICWLLPMLCWSYYRMIYCLFSEWCRTLGNFKRNNHNRNIIIYIMYYERINDNKNVYIIFYCAVYIFEVTNVIICSMSKRRLTVSLKKLKHQRRIIWIEARDSKLILTF